MLKTLKVRPGRGIAPARRCPRRVAASVNQQARACRGPSPCPLPTTPSYTAASAPALPGARGGQRQKAHAVAAAGRIQKPVGRRRGRRVEGAREVEPTSRNTPLFPAARLSSHTRAPRPRSNKSADHKAASALSRDEAEWLVGALLLEVRPALLHPLAITLAPHYPRPRLQLTPAFPLPPAPTPQGYLSLEFGFTACEPLGRGKSGAAQPRRQRLRCNGAMYALCYPPPAPPERR
jgi:hypothetical protein